MGKLKSSVKKFLIKHGSAIAGFAFVFATIAANTSCVYPFYEPEEPEGIRKLKKIKN